MIENGRELMQGVESDVENVFLFLVGCYVEEEKQKKINFKIFQNLKLMMMEYDNSNGSSNNILISYGYGV